MRFPKEIRRFIENRVDVLYFTGGDEVDYAINYNENTPSGLFGFIAVKVDLMIMAKMRRYEELLELIKLSELDYDGFFTEEEEKHLREVVFNMKTPKEFVTEFRFDKEKEIQDIFSDYSIVERFIK